MSRAQEVIKMCEEEEDPEVVELLRIADVFSEYGYDIAGAVRNIQGSYDVRVFERIPDAKEDAIRRRLSGESIVINDIYMEG